MNALTPRHRAWLLVTACALGMVAAPAFGQGVTTASINGLVVSDEGTPLAGATVTAIHEPSATQYRATVRSGGVYTIPNMRVGGPYRVTVTMIGFQPRSEPNVFLSLGQNYRLDFRMQPQAVTLRGVEVTAEQDPVLNAGRTGAATTIDPEKVARYGEADRARLMADAGIVRSNAKIDAAIESAKIYLQMQGKAGPRQRKELPRYGVTHNLGGFPHQNVCSISVIGKYGE